MTDSAGIAFEEARAPDGLRLYAIGDVHGRLDLLAEMHRLIGQDLSRTPPADWRVIHLGDYVDRGPDSRGVVKFLIEAQRRDGRVLAVSGNHDIGFLQFMAGGDSSLFIRFGGGETALSYGVVPDFSSAAGVAATRAALAAAVPDEHKHFLAGLPATLEFGHFFFCHAGIRPLVELAAQDATDLAWIRDIFLDHEELHPKVVVHGHTPVAEIDIRRNRVNLDTGACFTGRLSALVVEGSEKRVLQITG